MNLLGRMSTEGQKWSPVRLADGRVDAIGRDDQVGVGELFDTRHVRLEVHLDAQLAGALLQEKQKRAAGAAAKAVAADPEARVLVVDRDVVPIGEVSR